MAEEKEVLQGVLSTLYLLDEQGVASLYKEDGVLVDDALDRIKALDVERVSKLRTVDETAKKEQFQFGERKAHEAWEKRLKAHGIKSDKRGPDLVDELANTLKASKMELTDEVVKTTTPYRTLEEQYQKAQLEVEERVKTAIAERDATYQRERIQAEVNEHAIALVAGMSPIGLPKDPAKQKAFLAPVLSELHKYHYQVQQDNGKSTFLPVKTEGGRLEDNHGHQVKFNDLVSNIAQGVYEFEQGEKRSSAGSPSNGAQGTKTLVDVPTDHAKRAEMLFDMDLNPDKYTPEQRKALVEGSRK